MVFGPLRQETMVFHQLSRWKSKSCWPLCQERTKKLVTNTAGANLEGKSEFSFVRDKSELPVRHCVF